MSAEPLPAFVAEEVSLSPRSWRRWPCPRCGHRDRRFAVLCPACEALPWDGVPPDPGAMADRIVAADTPMEVRGRGPFFARHRFSTSAGFLGVLSRRLTGGAHWLGADGGEWFLRRYSMLGRFWVAHDGRRALAAAEALGAWRGAWRLWQGGQSFRLGRAGIARHNFILAIEDGPEILRIHGGLLNPLRRLEIPADVPLASVILASCLACGMRHGEGED